MTTTATVKRDALLEAFGLVSPALGQKAVIQAFTCFRFRLDGGSLWVAASNNNLFLETSIPASSVGALRACIPAQRLTEIIRNLEDVEVRFEFVNTPVPSLTIKSGRSTFRITAILPYDAMPAPASVVGGVKEWVLPAAIFGRALSAVSHAMSQDETRATLQGVQVLFQKDLTLIAATDGRRLAHLTIPGPTGLEGGFVMPDRSVLALSRLLNGSDGVLTLNFMERFARGVYVPAAGTEGGLAFTFHCALVDGTYPDTMKVAGAPLGPTTTKVLAPASFLREAAKRVALAGASANATPAMRMEWAADGMEFSSQSNDFGSANERFLAKVEGPAGKSAVNPRFLTDALASVGEKDANVTFGNSASPVRIASGDFLALVMPVRGSE